jgi:hypothetical protein
MLGPATKAWVSLIGSILTMLLGLSIIPVTGVWHTTLTVASAICTAIATYAVRNAGTISSSVVP